MKPICLEFRAFGPYLEKTVIDFEALNEARLFLISGPTGGGKTSILDAMCFALYCRATGGKRDFASMRCGAAAEDVPTQVSFDFAMGEKVYRFRRECYLRRNRNTKNWEMHTTHECFERQGDDMVLLESGSETAVRKRAEQLLHLTCEQFSQVMVLPQGNFLQFLRASSKEKGLMLETLFTAGVWKKISEILGKRLKQLDQSNQKLMVTRASLLRQEELEDERALRDKITEVSAAARQYRKQTEELAEKLAVKDAELAAAERFTALCAAKQAAVKQLAATEAAYDKGVKALAEAQEQKRQGEALAAEAVKASQKETRLQEIKVQLMRIRGMEGEAATFYQKAAEESKKLETIGQERAAAEKSMSAGLLFQQKAQESAGLLSGLLEQQAEDTALLRVFEEQDELRRVHGELVKSLAKARKDAEEAGVTAAVLTERLTEEEARSRQDAAYRLTAVLRDGEPCPVCGSREHPGPAEPRNGCMGESELQLLRESEQKAWEERVRLESICTQITGQARQALLQLEEKQKAHQSRRAVDREALQKGLQALQLKIAQYKKDAALLPRANEKLERLQREKEKLTLQENQAKTEAAAFTATADGLMKSAKKVLSELSHTDLPLLEEEIRKAGAEARRLTAESEKSLAVFQNAERALTEAKAFHASAKTAGEKAEREYASLESPWSAEKLPDLEPLRQETGSLREQSLLVSKNAGSTENALASLEKVRTATEKIQRELQKNEAVYGRVALLARSFAGGNPQKTPILQYVLSIMLDEILASANSFFSMLSRGRYALLRMEDRKGGNALGGLDIEVMDGASSMRRSVETLSGGEQFLASLSLAFGLSDVVQNASGAVMLDALFIDEGFGSLDTETLETAMKALGMIQEGGRTVGVISHVSEMKQYILTKIEVTRDSAGFAHATVKSAQ